MTDDAVAPFDEKAARRRAKTDWLRALERTAPIESISTRTLGVVVEERAAETPRAPALIGETETLTYDGLATLANRVARWAIVQGLHRGDRVALVMNNAPAYAAIWIGLSRIGLVVALIGPHLAGESLAGCIAAASPKLILVDADASEAARAALRGAAAPPLWSFDAGPEASQNLGRALADLSGAPLDRDQFVPPTLADPALLIYTSGTTGLPKAAHVSHFRVMMWSEWLAGVMDARPQDRLYDCLPMHHSIGGVAAPGAMLVAGGAVIVRRSFSASRFWADIAQSGATIFQYIGELPRYLLSASTGAPQHNALRLAIGAGLRGDIWSDFQRRFAIPRILEFYAATEGVFSLFNIEGKPGAIGRMPPFIAHRSPIALVEFDDQTSLPRRGADSFCLRCATNDTGEAIGRIEQFGSTPAARFEGYANAQETDRKILRDVFTNGDAWFRTGDLMRQDEQGYFYFVDRIGDTFRWKGENVSTSQVESILARVPGVRQTSVYGVAIPAADGRAGMAALVVDGGFNVARLARETQAHLPHFARPRVLRILADMATTGTFRPKKAELAKEGFDPGQITDALFVLDVDGATYERLDRALHAQILSGARRL